MKAEDLTETLVYDAMIAIQENSKVLCDLINRVGTDEEKQAFKRGVYAPCIKLQMLLSEEAMLRGKTRYAKIEFDAKAFFEGRKP